MSALQRTILKSKLPPRPSKSMASFKTGAGRGRRRDYTPASWSHYWNERRDVQVDGGTFRVYLSAPPDVPQRPRLVLLHGGGYSGLSWSLLAAQITSTVHCQVVALDLRGHGDTVTENNDDLNAETLSRDVTLVLEKLFGGTVPVVLMGHSMGGAIAVRVAGRDESLDILGLVVIDVVEGTAMDSLSSMQSFLRGRPANFKSVENAVEWCVRSGQTRNIDSAKVSMPGQIINCKTGVLASSELEEREEEEEDTQLGPPAKRLAGVVLSDCIAEEECSGPLPPPPALTAYRWRIDLSRTESYWPGWFRGLSSAFLAVTQPKLLLLASISGLDRELTVGQMQGKFQMQVLTRCGHAVHEDCPEEVSAVLAAFLLRHKFTEACVI